MIWGGTAPECPTVAPGLITPKRALSLRAPSPRHCARETQLFEEMPQRWRAVINSVSDLTSPRFELQTSRSREDRVTALQTDCFMVLDYAYRDTLVKKNYQGAMNFSFKVKVARNLPSENFIH